MKYILEIEIMLNDNNKKIIHSYSNDNFISVLTVLTYKVFQWKNFYKNVILRSEDNEYKFNFQKSDLKIIKSLLNITEENEDITPKNLLKMMKLVTFV